MSREVQTEAKLKLETAKSDKGLAEKAHQSLKDEAIKGKFSFPTTKTFPKILPENVIQTGEKSFKLSTNTNSEQESKRSIETDKQYPKDTNPIDSKTQPGESFEKLISPNRSAKNKDIR